jgi:hypothetical protein
MLIVWSIAPAATRVADGSRATATIVERFAFGERMGWRVATSYRVTVPSKLPETSRLPSCPNVRA